MLNNDAPGLVRCEKYHASGGSVLDNREPTGDHLAVTSHAKAY